MVCIPGPTSAGTHRRWSPYFNMWICVCFNLYREYDYVWGKFLLSRPRRCKCCAKFLRVPPCLHIQRGCKCEKVSWDTAGNRTSRESRLSETLIVWRNISFTFARDIRILVRGVNQILIQCLMCDFVPVLADNPLAYCPAHFVIVCTGMWFRQGSSVGLLAVKSHRCFSKTCQWPHECYYTLRVQV